MKKTYLKENQSIQSAIDKAEKGEIIVLLPHVYNEKVIINVDGITLLGQSGTQIVYGDYAKKIHEDSLEFNTFRTYTVIVEANFVTLENLTIENNAYSPTTKGQAVALTVYGNNFKAQNVTLKSMQDTLFLGPLPDDLITRYDGFLRDEERFVEGELFSYFNDCKIYGSLDYIFGCGTALFEDCQMINIDDNRVIAYVCAPAHSLKQPFGFTFNNCEFLKEDGFESQIYLARPWRDYGKCTFINCKTKFITADAFDRWNDSYRHQTARFEHYNCNLTPVSWAKQLTDDQAKNHLNKMQKLCKG